MSDGINPVPRTRHRNGRREVPWLGSGNTEQDSEFTEGRLMSKKKPVDDARGVLILPGRTWDQLVRMIQCPKCGHVDDDQCFDMGGADPDCVFCTQCHQEIQL